MKARKFCWNRDNNPVCPPSKVFCKKCLDKMLLQFDDVLGKKASIVKELEVKE